MANTTTGVVFNGLCPSPFLDMADYPHTGGALDGRLCALIESFPGQPHCCLPCPATDWVYSNSFTKWSLAASWLNVVGLTLLVFVLVSYAVLPTEKTRSHYLSICLVVSISFITIGFTIPLASQPDQCYDAITPNDMYTSDECAWSGAFIVAGGLTATVWIFVKALSMNLQICWDVVPGKKFFYASQALGWGVSAILFATTMTFTGVSFRFGSACHVNHDNAMAGFWGPLMAIAAGAGILQLITFGYCIHVYLKNLWTDDPSMSTQTSTGSNLPSYSSSVRPQIARVVYQRLKKVLWLQWRGIANVTIILVDVVFFSIVFLTLDGMREVVVHNTDRLGPWYNCLVEHPTEPGKCIPFVQGWLVKEPVVIAVLVMMSLSGLQSFSLLMRPPVFRAWWDLATRRRKQEFVSLDARNTSVLRGGLLRTTSKQDLLRFSGRGQHAPTFEMQQSKTSDESGSKSHVTIVSRPDEIYSPNDDRSFSPCARQEECGRVSSPPPREDSPPLLPPLITAIDTPRGRVPKEYFGRITPSPVSGGGSASANVESYDSHSQTLSPSDIHSRHHALSTSNSHRQYRTPTASFSTPLRAPSRNGSQRSASEELPTCSRGGLDSVPPSGELADRVKLRRDAEGCWRRRGMI